MQVIAILFAIGSFFGFMAALMFMESAPQQGAMAGLACYLAIMARIFQASHHHQEIQKFQLWEKNRKATDPAPSPTPLDKTV